MKKVLIGYSSLVYGFWEATEHFVWPIFIGMQNAVIPVYVL